LNIQFLPCISWQTNSLDILSLAIHFTISSFLDLAHNSVLPYQHTLSTMHFMTTKFTGHTFTTSNLFFRHTHSTMHFMTTKFTAHTHTFHHEQLSWPYPLSTLASCAICTPKVCVRLIGEQKEPWKLLRKGGPCQNAI
jgi:hypothetical protein